jgi:hypothetical protein
VCSSDLQGNRATGQQGDNEHNNSIQTLYNKID